MSNSSIWPIDRTLSSALTPGQSEPGNNGNERVLHIPQSSKTGASPSDCLVSYPRHLLEEGFYPTVEIGLGQITEVKQWWDCSVLKWVTT